MSNEHPSRARVMTVVLALGGVGLSVGASGCSKGATTPAGTIGEVDLKPLYPSTMMIAPDAEVTTHEATHSICARKDVSPVEVKVQWKTATKGADAYITSYSVAVTKPSAGMSVRLGGPPRIGNANKDKPMMSTAQFEVRCSTNHGKIILDDAAQVALKADGVSSAR